MAIGVREAEGCGRGMQCVGMVVWGRRGSQGRADVVMYEGIGNGLQDSLCWKWLWNIGGKREVERKSRCICELLEGRSRSL